MKNMFFVWKDPNWNGVKPEWIQMTGEEFYAFVTKPENKARYFIWEYWDPDHTELGYYKMETTEEAYKDWDARHGRENRAETRDMLSLPRIGSGSSNEDCNGLEGSDYEGSVNDCNPDDIRDDTVKQVPFVLSMDDYADRDEELTFHDVIADPRVDVCKTVEERIIIEELYALIDTLPVGDREFLKAFVDCRGAKSIVEIAQEIGLKKDACYKKLYKFKKIAKKVFHF